MKCYIILSTVYQPHKEPTVSVYTSIEEALYHFNDKSRWCRLFKQIGEVDVNPKDGSILRIDCQDEDGTISYVRMEEREIQQLFRLRR